MIETPILPLPKLEIPVQPEAVLDPSKTTAEALEAMTRYGVSFVENYIPGEACDHIVASLDPDEFIIPPPQDELPQLIGRSKYEGRTPPELLEVRAHIIEGFDQFASENPLFTGWGDRLKNRLPADVDIVHYGFGKDIGKHVDDPETAEWHSQVLVTLEGEGTLLVYDYPPHDDRVLYSIPLRKGTAVFLGGSETGMPQRPHEVIHNGERTLAFFDPGRWEDVPVATAA